MSVTPATIRSMQDAVQSALTDKAGDLLRQRLVTRFDEVLAGTQDLEDCLKRTRVAVRIFVDEELAQRLDQKLRDLAGLDD